MKIRFLSANEPKLAEVRKILEPIGVEVLPIARRIEEIQTENELDLVRDKLTKAFSLIGRPLFVEHTGLYLDGLNGLPAGLTRIFWTSGRRALYRAGAGTGQPGRDGQNGARLLRWPQNVSVLG